MTAESLDMIPSNMDSEFLSPLPGSSVSEIFPTCFDSTCSFSSNDVASNDNSFIGTNSNRRETSNHSFCAGCGKPIYDQYILKVAPDMEWHANCLKCADCGDLLNEKVTCYVRNGKTYCKRDYTKLFGTKCNKCGLPFSQREFVMRAKNKVYHADCFQCYTCQRRLFPGDEFAFDDDQLLCTMNHDVFVRSDVIDNSNGQRHMTSFPHSNMHGRVLSPMKEIHSSERLPNHPRNNGSAPKRKDSKTTRVRTVLNEKQLHTLRSCYAANCRPDALMKEQLTEMTGLSARVIRVWFQNKRCKDKKRSLALKQIQEQSKHRKIGEQNGTNNNSNLSPINGVPMVASEPVQNDSSNLQPIEVHNYQQPAWKALSEFALQSDMEQPGFQEFMSHFSDPGQSSMSDSSEICSIPSVSSANMDLSTSCSTPFTVDSSICS